LEADEECMLFGMQEHIKADHGQGYEVILS